MKLLIIVITSFIILFYYTKLFESAVIGIIFILICLLSFNKKFGIDKRYREFINEVETNEYRNIDEALDEYKSGKKYLFGIFNKENTETIEKFKKLSTTKKDFNRFIEIQDLKNQFIERSYKLREKFYILNLTIILISFVPFVYLRYSYVTYYYSFYVGKGYYRVLILTVFEILINLYNIHLLNSRKMKECKLYNDYSLCFHRNCLDILEINNDRLIFDEKGNAMEINLPVIEKQKIHLFSISPLLISLLLSYGFIV